MTFRPAIGPFLVLGTVLAVGAAAFGLVSIPGVSTAQELELDENGFPRDSTRRAPARRALPRRDGAQGRFFNFLDIFGRRQRGAPEGQFFPDGGGVEFGQAPLNYDLAPADVSLGISFAHRRQYNTRRFVYKHHYPYAYYDHPYRTGFAISMAGLTAQQ